MTDDNAGIIASIMLIVPSSIAFGYWQDSWAAGLAFAGMLAILDHHEH